MSSPPILHTPFPISQITSSTIVLGSSGGSELSSMKNTEKVDDYSTVKAKDTSSPTIANTDRVPKSPASPSPSPSNVTDSGTTPTITIPFSDTQIQASASLLTSSDPPERCTSPRRDNVAIEKIGREKVQVLRKEAQLIQESLTDILDRIVKVKEDYDRLSNENRFLQDYIGNLMSTSNILNKTHHG